MCAYISEPAVANPNVLSNKMQRTTSSQVCFVCLTVVNLDGLVHTQL